MESIPWYERPRRKRGVPIETVIAVLIFAGCMVLAVGAAFVVASGMDFYL